MKKMYVVACVLMLFCVSVFAGEMVNFSGDWSFDKSKSEFGEGGDMFIPVKIKITQAENSMKIERTFQREYEDDFVDVLEFTLDGKECESEFWNSPRIIKATWSEDGKALSIETKIVFNRDGQENEMITNDVWNLSDDGNAINQNFSFNSPMGEIVATYVFQKM